MPSPRLSFACAHLADEHLVAAFNPGATTSTATAARVFGVPVEGTPRHFVADAKAVNFGIVYGQQASGHSNVS